MVKFPELEEKWLAYWREHDVFAKTLAKPAPAGNFVFFEGPPTANGKPGIHHVLARAFKDLIPRYKTMRGFKVERKAGWDTQGLPVELQVEKELGFKGKPDIEKYGVKEFNEQCKKDVWKYQEDWEKLTERMGFWLDLEHPYVTYERPYIESLWWILSQVHKAGLLYQDYKVLPHCPRCATALSSHEVALGYKSIPDKAVYVKFKIRPGQNVSDIFTTNDSTFILSWTTTPWTLPGNVALAVGEDIEYEIWEQNGDYLIVAAKCREQVGIGGNPETRGPLLGKRLVGLQYEPLFDIKPLQNDKSHRVYAAPFVTTTDGTGVVHTAVMYGEDDFNLGSEVGLPKYHTVDENGNFTADVPQWQGKFVKDKAVEQGIVEDLKSRGLLFSEETYTHDYPFCWRCGTPLLYYAKPSWFIKMSALKEELKAGNEAINWYPGHIKYGRFGEWLDGIKDWAISRERYWGTPLPIWRCTECKHEIVIGSVAELSEKSGVKFTKDFDPHRPFIDEVSWSCKQCGKGEVKRVPEVADCWFDSGSMPFAQWGYPHAEGSSDALASHYPADFISEAIDQTRGWFYTLLAVATLLKKAGAIKEVPPYRNVICLGHINDAKGQKMSKSKGNVVDPWDMIGKYGIDAVRLHLYTVNQPGEPKNFDEKEVDEVVKKTFLILMNVVTFYELYKGKGAVPAQAPGAEHVMDKWVLALLQQLTNEVTSRLEAYEVTEAGRKLAGFVTELSTWYVRRSRDRFKEEGADKQAALATLGYALSTLAKLMAPFTPFVAEEAYTRVSGTKESVHLEVWPETKELTAEQGALLLSMDEARHVVEMALAQRAAAGMKVRQPLRALTVRGANLSPESVAVVAEEVNVLNVEQEVGPELSVSLDTTLDDELTAMGQVREFTRQVNALRKAKGLTIKDKVNMVVQAPAELRAALTAREVEVLRAVIASSVVFTDEPQEDQLEVGESQVSVRLAK